MKSLILLIFLFIAVEVQAQPQWVIYTQFNSGLPSNLTGTILIDSNNVKWITTANGLAKLQGNNWTVFDTTNSGMPSNRCYSIAKDKQNNLWITLSDFGLVKYDGINWTVYNEENIGFSIKSITNVCIDSLNIKWIGYAGGLLKYNDTVWTRYHKGNSGIPGNGVYSIICENSVLWVGTVDAGVGRFDGQSWTIYNYSNSGLPSNWVYGISKDIYNNIWFATRFGGAAKFNYNLNQWTVYNTGNSGIPSNYVLNVYADNNNVKWIGMYEHLAIFNDTTWQVFSYPFISAVLNFAKDRHGNMWICTSGGLYVYNPAGVVGVENNSAKVIDDFELLQNYPNPFNQFSIIQFQVASSKFIKLVVYDLLGREVKTLVNEYKQPGTYQVSFNAEGLSSGVYFYRMTAGDFSETKKLVLMK